MKAIMEFKSIGAANGKVIYYPKTARKVPLKQVVTGILKGFTNQKKKEYSKWERYDYYLNNVIKDYKLDGHLLDELNSLKSSYNDMKEHSQDYTVDNFDSIINSINNTYLILINDIEIETKTKYNRDYIL